MMNVWKAGILVLLCAAIMKSVAGAEDFPALEGDWREVLAEVCSKTDISMTLSVEELESLVARCGKLEARIGQEDEVVRKIYLKRVKRCKDLFIYVLQSKAADVSGGDEAETPVKEDQENSATP